MIYYVHISKNIWLLCNIHILHIDSFSKFRPCDIYDLDTAKTSQAALEASTTLFRYDSCLRIKQFQKLWLFPKDDCGLWRIGYNLV